MTTPIGQMKLDILELSFLLEITNRERNKRLLLTEFRRVKWQLEQMLKKKGNVEDKDDLFHVPEIDDVLKNMDSNGKMHALKYQDVTLEFTGWSQVTHLVYLHLDLKGIHLLPRECIEIICGKRDFELRINRLYDKNYYLSLKGLYADVKPRLCKYRLKPNNLTIRLEKNGLRKWKYLSESDTVKYQGRADIETKDHLYENTLYSMRRMYKDDNDHLNKSLARDEHETITKDGNTIDFGSDDFELEDFELDDFESEGFESEVSEPEESS